MTEESYCWNEDFSLEAYYGIDDGGSGFDDYDGYLEKNGACGDFFVHPYYG
jgi:hypothetical protein